MKSTATTKQYFFTLNLTYYMQALAVLAFGIVIAFLIIQGQRPPSAESNMWMYIVSISLISGLVLAWFIFRLLLGKIDASLRLQERMPRYARAILVRSSLIEVPGLLASIAAYVTANIHFLAVSLFIFLVFLIMRPTRNTIIQDLNLSGKEKALLEDDNAVVSEIR